MKKLILIIASLLLSSNLFANIITLYDQPNGTAKIVGKLDSEKGLIPIFTQKDRQWIKIANPQDGTVGWAKSSDLKVNPKSSYTFTERIIRQGNDPQSIIKFGEPKPLTEAQKKEYVKKMQERQRIFQQDMQRMMQSMFGEFNNMSNHLPVLMPLVLIPDQAKPIVKTEKNNK
jgi:hypothetical protein